MIISRRTFLSGAAAAAAATIIRPANARAESGEPIATLIDISLCDGCEGKDSPLCIQACRTKNRANFPKPDQAMLKDYWPKEYHEDWSSKQDVITRLTPYNWLYVDEIYLEIDGEDKRINIPRRCMHCDKPPCVELCPFGTAKKSSSGPVYIEQALCFGGAKCRSVCPWHVPQRQAGVGIYTKLDPIPIGGGSMFKCDLCRDLLAQGQDPVCMSACPRKAMLIGPRAEIEAEAQRRADQLGGYIYGKDEHGGTTTLYVSQYSFKQYDDYMIEDVDPKSVMRFHKPDNKAEDAGSLAKMALLAPFVGALGAFATTINKQQKGNPDEKD